MRHRNAHIDRISKLGKVVTVGALAVAGGYAAATINGVAASTNGAAPVPAQVDPSPVSNGFVPIASYRTFDSRLDPDESGKIFIKEQRFVDAALDLDGVERIPDQATAVTFNVTVTDTQGWGFVQIAAPGTGLGETSTVNWTGDGQTIANSGSTTLYLGVFENNLLFHVDGASGGAHVIIDITGYYVPVG